MRTTVTLRDDVFRSAKIEAAERGKTFSEIVQEALLSKRGSSLEPFEITVSSASGPLRDGLSYDRMIELLDYLDAANMASAPS